MPLVYIAGPYSKIDGGRSPEENTKRAEAAARWAWRNLPDTDAVIVPHATFQWASPLPYVIVLQQCLALLDACGTLVLLPDYVKSTGARAELHHFRRRHPKGEVVYLTEDDL